MHHLNTLLPLPDMVRLVLEKLNGAGFSAYLVGGCVRDALLGKQPQDWDITTSARPEEIEACFVGHSLVLTGRRHGTVGVIFGKALIEITTYRIDGAYSDHRHPDAVAFSDRLEEDLARRDFTINAMAWHPQEGLQDYFSGAADLQNGILRCVGVPARRLREDALRIVRGARFACTLGFAIEEQTLSAMLALCPLLDAVAAERVLTELNKALTGAAFGATFAAMPLLFFRLFRELPPDEARLQAALCSIEAPPPSVVLRLALLFALLAPEPLSAAQAFCTRLRYDRATTKAVLFLLQNKDAVVAPAAIGVKQWLRQTGAEQLHLLLNFQNYLYPDYPGTQDAALAVLAQVLAQEQCYRLADLAVSGNDLLAQGLPPGKAVGQMLNDLLDAVINGKLPNEREALLCAARDKAHGTL